MAIRKPKPTSPGQRFATYPDFAEVTKTEPEKSLVEGLTKSGGRNARGRKTSRHRGGGAKRLYRKIDFKRTKDGVPAKVAAIEYDPNRSAYIALLYYVDGAKAYILAPARLEVGAMVVSGPESDIRVGNALPLANIHQLTFGMSDQPSNKISLCVGGQTLMRQIVTLSGTSSITHNLAKSS